MTDRLKTILHDARLLILSIFAGLKFLFSRGAYGWIKETKEEENFTWSETMGLVFFSGYRREKHWEND